MLAAPGTGPVRIWRVAPGIHTVIQPRVQPYIVLKLGEAQARRTHSAMPWSAGLPRLGSRRGATMEDRNMRAGPAQDATYSVTARRFHWWTFTFLAVREVSSFAVASPGYAGMFDLSNIACGFAMWR